MPLADTGAVKDAARLNKQGEGDRSNYESPSAETPAGAESPASQTAAYAPRLRVVGGIDFSADRDGRRSLAEARAKARPILREWVRKVEQHVIAGKLSPIDLLTARELTNYPSSNEGRCFAGQERLAAAIGRCVRTARSSLRRLVQAGLLTRKRGGPGRTANWTFCVGGQPIFSNAEFAAQDRQDVAAQDRQLVADNPLEEEPSERKPPLSPAADVERPQGGGANRNLEGEAEPAFEEFWKATVTPDRWRPGPASVQWAVKLTRGDRLAIGRLMGPHGIDLDGFSVYAWLVGRRWEKPRLHGEVELASARIAELKPGTPEWIAERDRRRAAGESTKLMEMQAQEGTGWSIRR